MPMVESALNNGQINVPPRLPMILKQFCKAAIRTQPYDLLKWSSAYFHALAEGEEPPTKIRLECPLPQTLSGLTIGFLKVLLRQLGDYNKVLTVEAILRRWDDLCLDRRDLNLIMIIGKFRRRCQVKKFLAIAVGLLSSSLFETMLMICELFTLEPDGGSAMIPVSLFMEIYGYLAGLKCDGGKRDSSEEDPSEFLIFDKADSGPRPPEIRGTGSESNAATNAEQGSLASQDTEADVDVDLESSSKEPDSDVKDGSESRPEGSNRSTSSKGTNTPRNFQKIEKSSVDITGSVKSPSKESASERCKLKCREEDPRKIDEHVDDESSNSVTLTSDVRAKDHDNDEKISTDNARKKLQTGDKNLMIYYPDIPGIGPRLMPEEIAAVAMWMTECAKLQEGMIGPRNLRHYQCPSLDRRGSLES